jgi:hypothetical protein
MDSSVLPYDKYASSSLATRTVLVEWVKRHGQDLISFALLVVFILGGAAVFWKLEGVDTGFQVTPVYPCNQTDVAEPLYWSYQNCLYFVIVTLTTVGMCVPRLV